MKRTTQLRGHNKRRVRIEFDVEEAVFKRERSMGAPATDEAFVENWFLETCVREALLDLVLEGECTMYTDQDGEMRFVLVPESERRPSASAREGSSSGKKEDSHDKHPAQR